MSTARTEAWVLRRGPMLVAATTVGALLLGWLAIVAIDVLDVFGLRDFAFVQRESDYPYVFYHLFADNHPVEWLQWGLLLVAVVAVAVTAGILRVRGTAGWGVGLLSVSLGVVALQDAGNQRDVAANLAYGLAGAAASTAVEILILGVVGLLAVAGLVVAWPVVASRARVRNLFLAGYATYGLVGLMDMRSELWYVGAGEAVLEGFLGGRLLAAPASWEPGLREWLFMDAVVEESLELVGAGLLAMAALLLLRETVALRAQVDVSLWSTVSV